MTARTDSFAVTEEEIREAYEKLDEEIIAVIREAADNIRRFHEKQRQKSWITTEENGTILGQKITPLDSAGVYVPGGTAAYPSSVLMNVIPAKVAGVERIVMVSPPGKDGKLPPAVLVAADIAGVKEIYKVGGAQAIAALAYGTESIRPVDKITGPGNIYVALAKREVFGDVDIDMIAGPSEIAVLADETAVAAEVAADLLSQAEHDVRACRLVTVSENWRRSGPRSGKAISRASPKKSPPNRLKIWGDYVAKDMDEAVETVNRLAPEHLEIIAEAVELAGKIKHAGRFSSAATVRNRSATICRHESFSR